MVCYLSRMTSCSCIWWPPYGTLQFIIKLWFQTASLFRRNYPRSTWSLYEIKQERLRYEILLYQKYNINAKLKCTIFYLSLRRYFRCPYDIEIKHISSVSHFVCQESCYISDTQYHFGGASQSPKLKSGWLFDNWPSKGYAITHVCWGRSKSP